MPFFSVIIPAYNRLPYLKEALDSVRQQIFPDYEVIVVDDGSSDGTAEEALRYAAENGWDTASRAIADFESLIADCNGGVKALDSGPLTHDASSPATSYSPPATNGLPVLRLIRQANAGPGAARNFGAREAKGEYLAFLDSDDLWFPWTLEVCHQVILKSKFPSMVSAKLVEVTQKSELSAISMSEVEFESFADYFESSGKGFYVGAGMLFIKKLCFEATGGFTEMKINLEDHDLVLKCGIASGFSVITSPTTLAWRRHQGSLTHLDQKSIDGSNFVIEQEKRGNYPGGNARKKQRIQIICSHIRAVSMGALVAGHSKAGWNLYWKCLFWNLLLMRWKYIFGFPLKAISK